MRIEFSDTNSPCFLDGNFLRWFFRYMRPSTGSVIFWSFSLGDAKWVFSVFRILYYCLVWSAIHQSLEENCYFIHVFFQRKKRDVYRIPSNIVKTEVCISDWYSTTCPPRIFESRTNRLNINELQAYLFLFGHIIKVMKNIIDLPPNRH